MKLKRQQSASERLEAQIVEVRGQVEAERAVAVRARERAAAAEAEKEAVTEAELAGQMSADEARQRFDEITASRHRHEADADRLERLAAGRERQLVELGRQLLAVELEQAQGAEAGMLRTRNEASGAFGAASSSLEALMSTLEAARGEAEAAGARTRAAERALAEAGGEVPDDPDWLARERDEPDWASRQMSRRELEEFTERLGKVMRTGPTQPAEVVEERRAAAERSREEVIRQAVMNLRDIPANPGGELAEYRADILARLPDGAAREQAEREAAALYAEKRERRERNLRERVNA